MSCVAYVLELPTAFAEQPISTTGVTFAADASSKTGQEPLVVSRHPRAVPQGSQICSWKIPCAIREPEPA